MDTQQSDTVFSFSEKFLKNLGSLYCIGLEKLSLALVWGGCLFMFGGLVVLAYQVFVWLKYGHWTPILVLDAVYRFIPEAIRGWLNSPTDWLGVAEACWYVLRSPLAAFLMILFLPICWLGFYLSGAADRSSEEHRARWKSIEVDSDVELLRQIGRNSKD